MDMAAEIATFDGRRTDVLEALAARLSPDSRLVDELCALARRDDANVQSAATWLLKRFQENRHSFLAGQVDTMLDLLARVTSWDAKLHLLQVLPGFDIPEIKCGPLIQVLKGDGYLTAPNRFVRAWCYNGLAELAERDPMLREEVAALLAAGEVDEAASVRARIRNVIKNKPWVRLAAP